jgi:hypothetical protein
MDQSRRRLSTSKQNQDWIEENEKSQHGELTTPGETEIQIKLNTNEENNNHE